METVTPTPDDETTKAYSNTTYGHFSQLKFECEVYTKAGSGWNDWHFVTITKNGNNQYEWKNRAKCNWSL